MFLYIFLFICNLLVPVIMIIAGYFMYRFPPKTINGVYGYRTSMSRKNMDTWNFAHDCCGRLWFKLGIIIAIVTAVLQLFLFNASEELLEKLTVVIEFTQLGAMLITIFFVEKKLRKTFDKNGKRKHDPACLDQ